ncbi:MAG TPA: methyltransferase domain-containing protein [Chthoniobacterales bacterium]|nr:methyltransferase domain-containing protein [Chthoniobacterales bacterium]
MWLTRLRVQLKSVLPRESLLYRLGHRGYQLIVRLLDRFGRHNAPREITENSIFIREEELPMCSIFPKEILDLTLELFHPRSVLDVGCGTGISLDYFKSKGISVRGLEGSALAISKARNAPLILQHDLNEPINLEEGFDLVWCFEVAEHIHPSYVGALLATLTNHAERIVLSAARPGQGGLGHLNEQPPDYWIGRMQERGFALSHETGKYRELPDHFAENILIFERIDGPR